MLFCNVFNCDLDVEAALFAKSLLKSQWWILALFHNWTALLSRVLDIQTVRHVVDIYKSAVQLRPCILMLLIWFINDWNIW